jgi:serine/threonine-protein kinase HipA
MAGNHIATITESRGKMRLTYVPGAAQLGVPLISVAMPMTAAAYTDKVVRPFFNGLLPEGEARLMIAYDFGLDANDDMGLLAVLGRDCAGALIVLPAGETPAESDAGRPPEAIDDNEIERRLETLPVQPLGITGKIRASLPGVQPKLLLTRHEHQWCSPDDSHPSTHILKPAVAELENSVANEAFCLNVAARSGLRGAATSVAQFGGVTTLISERYDRQPGSDGVTVRLHQEDSCQALSVMTRVAKHKYESFGGPKLRDIAEALTQWGGSAVELLQHVAFSVLMGNADLHGKNISFLHRGDGTVGLAPIYDVMCTTHYDGRAGRRDVDTEMGLFIGGQTDILRVTIDDLVAEAKSWGMRPATARSTIVELARAVDGAIDQTLDELDVAVPDAIVERVRTRTTSFT